MKLGLVSYTNRTSGVGVFCRDIIDNFPVDSYFSVNCVKGQEQWLERQINGLPYGGNLAAYLAKFKPDMMLMVETAFFPDVFAQCRKLGITTVLIVMHESYVRGNASADWFICPTRIAYDKVPVVNKVYFDLPIDLRSYSFVLRKRAQKFLHVMGFGAAYNRRQTREVVNGFLAADVPDATLTVHCQQDWTKEYGPAPADSRVMFRLENLLTPAEVFTGHDVLVQPDSYAGYNRIIIEAKGCGLPVLTTDAPPMNELCTDTDALVPVVKTEYLDTRKQGHPYGLNMERHFVSADGVRDAIRRTRTWDMKAKSKQARKCAEAHSWTEERKADFWRLLEEMRNR